MKTASAETASPAGGVACRGFRLFRPQLTGGIKDLPILGLRHGLAVGDEHLQNNRSVRGTLVTRGIKPEDLPPEEDAKKLRRKVEADERKLRQDAPGFGPAPQDL